MWSKFLVILGIVLFGVHSLCLSLDEGQLSKHAYSKVWLKLMHYDRTRGHKFRSQIESPQFFLHARGIEEPDAELKANFDRLNSDPMYACNFPARAELLHKLRLTERASPSCPELEAWKNKLRGNSLSFVFVTQYISNPASIFGHSFILLKKEGVPSYLSPTISNAAAIPENISAWDYVVGGLGGKFTSDFSADPLYFKIQEYNNMENRDLWIYQLQLSSEQIELFLNHLWELSRNTTEGYLFLTKNCSVNAYNALAAVHSDLEFVPSGKLYVTPLETMKRVKALITATTYMPSSRERIAKGFSEASPEEQKNLNLSFDGQKNSYIENDQKLSSLSLEYFEYLKSQQGGQLTQKQEALYSELLKSRARLGPAEMQEQAPQGLDPIESFSTWRLGLNVSRTANTTLPSVSFSPLYHSLVQNQAGFLPNSELIVADFEWALEAQRKDFKKITAFQWANHPENNFDSQISWQAKLAFIKFENCDHCYWTSAQVDLGRSWALNKQQALYFLAGGQTFKDSITKPELIFGWINQWQKFKTDLRVSEILSFSNKKSTHAFEGRFNYVLTMNWDLNVNINSDLEGDDTSSIGVNYFF